MNQKPTIIQTDIHSKDGQNKCPKCGATEISLNTQNGKLRCEFCRYEFNDEKIDSFYSDISSLQAKTISSGAQNIVANAEDVITFRCSSCGAEVVVDTSESTQARCHWCRNVLSQNSQIPNGSVPDAVLPFHISKEEAEAIISKFVAKRKFFAHPKFREEFTLQNIMGVYFPYLLVNINGHAYYEGKGEKLLRRYTKGSGQNEKTYYDADLYNVEREFDLNIFGLSVESNKARLNHSSNTQTNNIINAIMPFDIENCVRYDSNFLKGFTSERRDANVEEVEDIISTQAKDISRFAANDTLKEYDRGVSWQQERFALKGSQWTAAYLPVWLYSYQMVNGTKKTLHYVAVNARTKEVMGSVPIYLPKLFLISFLIEIVAILTMYFWDFDWIFLLLGPLYFFLFYIKYRNKNARHNYEVDTKRELLNLRKVDNYVKRETGLTNSRIKNANNETVQGVNLTNQMMDIVAGNFISKDK